MLPKIVWNSLLVTPALLGAALFTSSSAIAVDLQGAEATVADLAVTPETVAVEAPVQLAATPAEATAPATELLAPVSAAPVVEAPAQLAQVAPEQVAPASTTTDVNSLEQIEEYGSEGGSASMSQVTSISQLSDVQPTDWAFQALQSLVERYGVIAGYPDGTYRGNRALTRYEFAAGLNAALDRVNELIAAGLADAVTREDLATLQRLQEEFAAELATLRGRVDALEARTAELEANQFSTTTRLVGRTIFSLSDTFGGNDILDDDEGNLVFQSRVRLNFDTSFTGEDRLRARLQWGNFNALEGTQVDQDPESDQPQGLFSDQLDFSYDADTDDNVELSRLEYYFPVGDNVTIYLEALGASISDIVTSVSSFDDPEQGSISYFGYNPIYDINPGEGIGAGATIDFSESIQLGFGYLTGEGDDPTSDSGLFNGDYAGFGQLTFGAGPLTIAGTYVNSYRDPLIVNAYGVSAQFDINDNIFLGGWATYVDADSVEGEGDSTFWTYAATLGFGDLGPEGSLLGFIVGVPPRLTEFEVGGTRVAGASDDDASLHIEGFYRLPVTDNITITPGVIWVLDPDNNNDNEDVVIGALRTTFSF